MVAEHQGIGLHARLLDRVGLRCQVALLRHIFVGNKRLDIEGIGPGLGIGEAILGLEPWPVAALGAGSDQQGLVLEVLEALDILMGNQHLRVFLEHRRHSDHRNAAFAHLDHLQVTRTHHALCLACCHHLHDVDLRASHLDRHIQTVFFVDARGDRLVKPTMLSLGIPVGHVGELFLRLACACTSQGQQGKGKSARSRCTARGGFHRKHHGKGSVKVSKRVTEGQVSGNDTA